MNINDLRANAYTKNADKKSTQKDSYKSENEKSSNIKPFIPQKISRADIQSVNYNEPAFQQNTNQFNQTSFQNTFIQSNIVSMTNNSKTNNTKPNNFKTTNLNSLTPKTNSTIINNSQVNNFQSNNTKQKNSVEKATENQNLNNSVNFLKTNGLLKVPVEHQNADGKDSVYRRVAKFLILIGDKEASKILPHLAENQIEKIIPEIASIRTIDNDEAKAILEEFSSLLNNTPQVGGVETAKDMLERAYGTKKANEMIQKAVPLEGKKPFEYLNNTDNEKVYTILKNENTGIKALILSHLEPKKAAEIINKMDENEKKDVILRMAKMEKMQPELILQIDKVVYEKSLKINSEQSIDIDGINALSQILRKMDFTTGAAILSNISEEEPELTKDLRSRMFTIEDIADVEDRFIQDKLREMSDSDICYLLGGKSEEFRCKILDNISSGRRTSIFEQEAILKPMRKSDVDRITSEFVNSMYYLTSQFLK